MNVRCLRTGLADLLGVVARESVASAPTFGLVSSWASSGEKTAGCVRNWLTHQTAASANDNRRIEAHRTLAVEPAANFARRMSASCKKSVVSGASPQNACPRTNAPIHAALPPHP